MEEISIVVKQSPGEVSWNFEEMKEKLEEALKVFKTTIYTDDTIKTAKTDVADLRKLKNEVESRRKEVKDKCLEPYNMIEAQAKELNRLIDEPINAIQVQVNDYEARRKDAVRKKIDEYWKNASAEFPEDLRDKAFKKIYDERWLNVTTTMKTWKEGIHSGISGIWKDLETIKSFHSDFEEDVLNVYRENLELQPAIMKMNELNEQRQRVLEIERRKAEEVERKAQEEARKTEPAVKLSESSQEAVIQEPKKNTEEPVETKHETVGHKDSEVITIIGSMEQINKIKAFIRYIGADFREGSI